MVYRDPNFAVGDRVLVHEKWLNDSHSVTTLFAIPECAHVLFAIPVRYRIPRIRVVLIAKEVLAPQSLRISANFQSLLEGRFESIPLSGQNFAPNDPHVHFDPPCAAFCDARRKPRLTIFQMANVLDCRR
jgi:hypothetical protein